jgi:hypothetical protein
VLWPNLSLHFCRTGVLNLHENESILEADYSNGEKVTLSRDSTSKNWILEDEIRVDINLPVQYYYIYTNCGQINIQEEANPQLGNSQSLL